MYTVKDSVLPLINCTWRAIVEHDDVYSDPANEYWSFGFIKHTNDTFSVEVYGPSLKPRVLHGKTGEEYWGVEFKAHVSLGAIGKDSILNAHITLSVEDGHFTIGSKQYLIPQFDSLEAFAQQLQQDGIITADERIYKALLGRTDGLSERSRQRYFKAVTGLTKKQIEQLQHARHAFYLLQHGESATQAAHSAGYADQSHMTRALKLLRGETPAQIIATYLKQS